MADLRKLARDIGSAPLGDLIASVGEGVAEAQAALDTGSLQQTLALYSEDDDLTRVMRETGYRPTFYTIPETEGELTLSLTVTGREGTTRPMRAAPATTAAAAASTLRAADLSVLRRPAPRLYAAPVDGGYSNSYSYQSAVGAKVKFRIVAVPPPAEAEALRVIPDFAALDTEAATALAARFDFRLAGLDDAAAGTTVIEQSPAPGTVSREGETVTLIFG